MTRIHRIEIDAESGPYTVVVGPGARETVPEAAAGAVDGGRVAVVSDSNVLPLHGEAIAARCRERGLEVETFTFPAGEASKTRARWAELTDRFLEAGLGRDACVVAVGGGVTTDLAGFVAATYMRGIPVVQVPTTYLAMVDASVGGKTGVDVAAGKNLVGAFHAPVAVVADTELLATLPDRDRREGLVEAVKHGAILDLDHLMDIRARLPDLLECHAETAADVVAASVRIKARVVAEDEREAGFRQVLNFGHTVGHALEAASGFSLGHGTAVALGMLAEAEVGERMGVTEEGARDRLAEVLRWLIKPPAGGVSVEHALGFLARDKKARGGQPRYVLLERLGRIAREGGWTRPVPDELVREAVGTVLEGA